MSEYSEKFLSQKLKNGKQLILYYQAVLATKRGKALKEVQEMKTIDFYKSTLRGIFEETERLIRLGTLLKEQTATGTVIKEYEELLNILENTKRALEIKAIRKGEENVKESG